VYQKGLSPTPALTSIWWMAGVWTMRMFGGVSVVSSGSPGCRYGWRPTPSKLCAKPETASIALK
jgi:hypothetical protein